MPLNVSVPDPFLVAVILPTPLIGPENVWEVLSPRKKKAFVFVNPREPAPDRFEIFDSLAILTAASSSIVSKAFGNKSAFPEVNVPPVFTLIALAEELSPMFVKSNVPLLTVILPVKA
jgi:hypothetical protein